MEEKTEGRRSSAPASQPAAAPPSRRRSPSQRQWAKAPDWLAAMPTIKKLYKDERKTLKEVMDIMEKQHNFYATPKMYKSKLKEWDISKSFKAQEILAVFHAMEGRQAEGKSSQFVMRGKEVDLKWVRHYIKRNRSRMKLDIAERKRSPSASGSGDEIVCRTLAPRPMPTIAAPGALQSAEELIRSMSVYIEGAWASNQWVFDAGGVLRSRKGETGHHHLLRLWGLLDQASQLMGRSEKIDLVNMLNPAFAYLDDIVRDECPRAVPFLFCVFDVLHSRGRLDLTELFLKYIKSLSLRVLGPGHPQTRVWDHAAENYPDGHDEVFPRYFAWLLDVIGGAGSCRHACRLDKALQDHRCAERSAFPDFETQELRLRLHIRMIEQDCRSSLVRDGRALSLPLPPSRGGPPQDEAARHPPPMLETQGVLGFSGGCANWDFAGATTMLSPYSTVAGQSIMGEPPQMVLSPSLLSPNLLSPSEGSWRQPVTTSY
ncbi:hypothetical protein GQ53DRAFT_327200 [Thozetella sp. PMI_491]|nr:hypothetical protein GQ53DRAFT_327200 [Thozetella sp. PMI_491]